MLSADATGITLNIDRLSRDKHELVGELVVRCGLPGARAIDGVLFTGNFNLSSQQTRERLGKHLKERAQTGNSVDWGGLLEELVMRTIAAEREGQPARLLSTYERPSQHEAFVVAGLHILKRHPTVMFGDGGTFKSYLGLYIAGLLARQGVRVLFADWELAGEDHRDRLERLFGPEMPGVLYVRCERPMTAEGDRLRRIVVEHGIGYVVCDSVAFAADGPPESAEVAAAYFRAVRQFGTVGSLHIAHITKSRDDDGDKAAYKPFGSVFWHNSARGTWYVKRAADTPIEEDRIVVGVYNRKANLGPLRRPVGLEIRFGADRTNIRAIDVADVGDLAAGLSISQRVGHLLKRGAPLTIHEIAAEVGAKPDSVEKALKRGADLSPARFVRLTNAMDGIHRWAVAENRQVGESDMSGR